MERGLARMVGQSSGFLEGLPAPVRARIAHLETLQEKHDELEDAFEEEQKALIAKYKAMYGERPGRAPHPPAPARRRPPPPCAFWLGRSPRSRPVPPPSLQTLSWTSAAP
jgi:hypothetical protein